MTDKGIPKSRREGKRGGMNYSGTQAASAKRGGDPGRYGGPPPKGPKCLFGVFLLFVYMATPVVAAGGMVWLRFNT